MVNEIQRPETMSMQALPRISQKERIAVLSMIHRQPREEWTNLVYMLGLDVDPEEMSTEVHK